MNTIGQRVEELLGQMNLREKIFLLSGRDSWNTAPVERLGIPALTMTDGPHGVRAKEPEAGRKAGPTTAFPTGISMGSSWNNALVERVGEALAEETRAMGCDILLGPCVNIVRHPLAGRNFETYSEDPYLAGRTGVAYVKGVQSRGIGTSLKHYACNNQEIERFRGNSVVDERTLREIYLPQFEMVVKETQPWTVMCSYNRINGVYASQHQYLLNDILRGEWGFEGAVISDWGANHTIFESLQGGLDLEMPGPPKYYGKLLRDAVANWQIEERVIDNAVRRLLLTILRSGKMNGSPARDGGQVNTPEHHRLAQELAEEAITLLKNDRGALPLPVENIKSLAVIGPNAAEMVVSGGGSSYVAPEDRVTPLQGLRQALGDRIEIRYEQGCDNYVDLPGMKIDYLTASNGERGLRGEYFPNPNFSGYPQERIDRKTGFWWFSEGPLGHPRYSVRWTARLTAPGSGRYTFKLANTALCRLYLDGQLLLESAAPAQVQLNPSLAQASLELKEGETYDLKMEYVKDNDDGYANLNLMFAYTPLPEHDERFERALQAARECDAAVVFIGNPEGYETEGWDRLTMELPGRQDELVSAVLSANPNTVVALSTGAPVSMPWISQAPAVVQMYYAGMQGGAAVARILTGEVNPSGKLSVTYPQRIEDNPAFGNCCFPGERQVLYGEGIYVGYRYYEARSIEPLFPFGHGLSYTTFEYSQLSVAARVNAGEPVEVSATIKNTGAAPGKEVVQLYVRDVQASLPRPIKELKGYTKIALRPGESQTVVFVLDERSLAFFDPVRSEWIAEPGEFEVLIGSSSADIRLRATFNLL